MQRSGLIMTRHSESDIGHVTSRATVMGLCAKILYYSVAYFSMHALRIRYISGCNLLIESLIKCIRLIK